MSDLARALLAELDDDTLDVLAARIAPRLQAAPDPGPWLNTDEAATYLRCSKQRIYDLKSAGHLESGSDNTRLLFHRDHLDAYLTTAQRHGAAA